MQRDCRTWPNRRGVDKNFPFIICTVHGKQHALAVCEHLATAGVGYSEKPDANHYAVITCTEHCSFYSVLRLCCLKCFEEQHQNDQREVTLCLKSLRQ